MYSRGKDNHPYSHDFKWEVLSVYFLHSIGDNLKQKTKEA